MDEIYKHAFLVCAFWDAQAFWLMNYCGFNIEPFCSDVCGDHRRPHTLAEICRNMGICCGFRAVAAKEKYSGSSYSWPEWPKWHWRSGSATSIFNTNWEYPNVHVWCQFGDFSSNLWWVIVRTRYSLRTGEQTGTGKDNTWKAKG